MITSSAGKVFDNFNSFEKNQITSEAQHTQNTQNDHRENAFQRQSANSLLNMQGSLCGMSNQQQNNTHNSASQVKRISNCSANDTPQQKVIRKQFSKSKERNSSLNNSSNNFPQGVTTVNNMSNNASNLLQNCQNSQNNNQNNVSALVNLQINTQGCSSVNDSSSLFTPSYNAIGYQTNHINYHSVNNNNNSAHKQVRSSVTQVMSVHKGQNNGSAIKQRESVILGDATNKIGNQSQGAQASKTTSTNNSNSIPNKNQYSSVPQKSLPKDFPVFEYTLQPRQSLLFKNTENIDPRLQSNLTSTQTDRRQTSERTNQPYYNIENKLPTQSDNLSTTKELDQEGQQHLRNVDNYQISTKCLNDLNSHSLNNRSRPFSLFAKKQEDYDISQHCDQSIIPQETTNSNGVSQTFQNNQRYKQSLPSTSSQNLQLNNENNYQTHFKDLLDWKVDGSKQDLNNSHDQMMCENNSTEHSNKPTENNLVSGKKTVGNCECLKELAELKIMISEMQKNQIIQAQINQKLQQDNENLWKSVRQLTKSESKSKDQDLDMTKDEGAINNEKENAKQIDKQKYNKIVKNLVCKNKELKKQNTEMESVLKDILLQNEISRQRNVVRDKMSAKNSRAHSRSGGSSNNETELISDNLGQNQQSEENTSQNYHIYRPRSQSNSQFASGVNSSKRGNDHKQQKSNPYQNILKKANILHENIEVLKQDSLILNQVGINLNTLQSHDNQNLQYTPMNENYVSSMNNEEQDNSNDAKIRQILSKIHHSNAFQNC